MRGKGMQLEGLLWSVAFTMMIAFVLLVCWYNDN